jgi:DNA adenine methylase
MAFKAPPKYSDEVIGAQLLKFPSSRYMGSKHAILPFIYGVTKDLEFETVLDAFAGSTAVSYLFKAMGKSVTSNDFLHFSYHTANACIANGSVRLSERDVQRLLQPNPKADDFIARTFSDLYFTLEENQLLDNISANIRRLRCPYKKSIAYASIVRSCLRRRPRGIFTYTGLRYEDGRRDLKMSMEEHFRHAVGLFNSAVFDNGKVNDAFSSDAFRLCEDRHYDLVYLDPPYLSPHSDNDYTRRYHFVEGLTRYWQGLEIQEHTVTKKFRRIPSLFDSKSTIHRAFNELFARYQDSVIVLSYSSNSIPDREGLKSLLSTYKSKVTVHEVEHLYSFGTHTHKVGSNNNGVKEYLFVGE